MVRFLGRRTIIRNTGAACASWLLTGCGFHPAYAPSSTGSLGPAQSGLAAIEIANIPNRPGQLLRQALQSRFEREGMGTAHRYDLYVAFGISIEGVSVQQDSSVARNRIVGSASWTLRAQDPTRSTLTTGNARSIDGVDIVNEQFFAADLNTETAQKRVCEALADQITLQLAAYFLRAS